MNRALLKSYGISFYKQANGNIKTTANSPNLDIFIYLFSRSSSDLEKFIQAMDLAVNGQYSLIPFDDREWHLEMGYQVYTGIIHDDLTFELFLEDKYDSTVEEFPLYDVREIFTSLQEFLNFNDFS